MTTTPRRRKSRQELPRQAPAPARAFPPPTDTSEALVEANLGLARQAAWRWSRKSGQPYDDLEAVAFMGLIRGCRRYDPDRINPANGRPYALSTIVCPYVNGEILHWFRDHGHAITYPSRWREQWGKVQRLLAEDLPPDQVAARAGLSMEELDEMLASMAGTLNLDDIPSATGISAPAIEINRLAPLQSLVGEAFGNLPGHDQRLLLSWWERPRRVAYPNGPLQQFHRRLKSLLSGRSLTQFRQLSLAVAVPSTEPKARAKPRRKPRTSKPVDQPSLLASES